MLIKQDFKLKVSESRLKSSLCEKTFHDFEIGLDGLAKKHYFFILTQSSFVELHRKEITPGNQKIYLPKPSGSECFC